MTVEQDIIIIGGGLLGAATAYQLSAYNSNLNITIIERHDVGAQASARAACLLTRLRTKPEVAAMVEETYRSIDRIEQLLGESLGLQQSGSITIGSSLATIQATDQLAALAASSDIPTQWLDASTLKDKLPWIDTTHIEKALFVPSDAYIDSAVWCNAMVRAAQQQGVKLMTQTEVEEIIIEQQQVVGVKLTNGDTLAASIVVNAAGAWSNLLFKTLKSKLAHTPVRSHFWITETNNEQFPQHSPFVVIPDARAFTRPDVGAMIIGLREPECIAYPPQQIPTQLEDLPASMHESWSTLSTCADLFTPFFPNLLDTGIAHYVAGPSCYVPDSNFLIGATSTISGLYAIAGCCGAGVAAGAGMGRLLAEIILEQETFVDPHPFRLDRFGEFDPFSQQFQQLCAQARANKKGG